MADKLSNSLSDAIATLNGRLDNYFKYATVTGNTDVGGSLLLSSESRKVVTCNCSGGYIAIPFVYSNGYTYAAIKRVTDFSAVTSTNVTVSYFFTTEP